MSRLLLVGLCLGFLGCLRGSDPMDPVDGGPRCTSNEACDDGVFCNGVELCAPEEEGAGADGCLLGAPPCGELVCREEEARCETVCPDADGDGQEDAACGGTDCDDSDRNVFLGATEVCDEAGIDDDCDPSTVGADLDGDGFPSVRCCNGPPSDLRCGGDCDDTRAAANPDAPEICNGLDDDCDGTLDEGVTLTFYRDADGDSYGDVTVTLEACAPPMGWTILSGDCNDANPNVSPGRPESCLVRGADDDCDGNIDEICDCSPSDPPITCGPGAPLAGRGVCRDGMQMCTSAGTYGDCMGGVYPGEETCDGLDEDCDGRVDEGSGRACPQNASVAGTTACGRPGVRRCGADCQWLDAEYLAAGETVESCDYCADTSGGLVSEEPFASATVRACRPGTAFSSCNTVAPVMVDLVGGARYVGEVFPYLELNAGISTTEAGAAWMPAVRLGYGSTTVRAEVSSFFGAGASSDFGWALSMSRSATPIASVAREFGAPPSLFSFRWRHADGDSLLAFFTVREDGTVSRVRETSSPYPEPSVSRGRGQRMQIAITPDDPATVVNETTVTASFQYQTTDAMGFVVWQGVSGTGGGTVGCGPCPFVLRPGDPIRFVLSGGGAGSPGVAHSLQELDVQTREACPLN